MEEEESLDPRQRALYEAYEIIAEAFGKFGKDSGSDGAHYIEADDNPFVEDGMMCANCCFYEGGQGCEIVDGQIDPMALCKLWIIDETLLSPSLIKADLTPPEGVRNAAQRALKWIADGKAGDGFTATGRYRAETLAKGEQVSPNTIQRMRSYFARHEVDKKAEGFHEGEKGYPSAGRVAWDAWGGDAGKSWVNSMADELEKRRRFNGDRSAAGRYAAQVRWSKGRSIDPTATDELGQTDWGDLTGGIAIADPVAAVGLLRREKHVSVYPDAIPQIYDMVLNGDGKENIRNLEVKGTKYFDDHGVMMERSAMPQVPSERKQEFLTDIAAKGISSRVETVSPRDLRPIQAEIGGRLSASIRQTEAARGRDAFRTGPDKAIIVSSDGYVMDGHHRWAAAAFHDMLGDRVQMTIIRVGAPRDALMKVMQDWTDQAGVARLGFGEERPRAGVGKVLAFHKSCEMAIKAQKELDNE